MRGERVRILALEPYFGGSHRAFLNGWMEGSRHTWTCLTLPPYKWKWRMRHSAITFADEVAHRVGQGEAWDLLFCSDMLDLAQFKGLAPTPIHRLPCLVYFHENQLTYPVRFEKERDLHFALANLSTALAADHLWFNSAFHQGSFLEALPPMLGRMPDHQPFTQVAALGEKSSIHYPGITPPPTGGRQEGAREKGPLRILWAARWEHDKNPEDFFTALDHLLEENLPFRVSVLGESFRRVPEIFAQARERLGDRVEEWGYLEHRDAYLAALARTDIFVSTAKHEFFGISAAEAMAAGAYPLLPRRLAYPELLAGLPQEEQGSHLYNGSPKDLAQCLRHLIHRVQEGPLFAKGKNLADYARERFAWDGRTETLDAALEEIAEASSRQA